MNDIERKSKTIKENQKKYYDKGAQNLPPLKLGDNVLLQDPVTREWDRTGVIVSIGKHRDYDVKLSSGRLLRRKRKFLHKISDNDIEKIEDMDRNDILKEGLLYYFIYSLNMI